MAKAMRVETLFLLTNLSSCDNFTEKDNNGGVVEHTIKLRTRHDDRMEPMTSSGTEWRKGGRGGIRIKRTGERREAKYGQADV